MDLYGLFEGVMQARERLSAVARTSAPANGFRLNESDARAAFCQLQRGRCAGEAASDNNNIGFLWESFVSISFRRGRIHRPETFVLCHEVFLCY